MIKFILLINPETRARLPVILDEENRERMTPRIEKLEARGWVACTLTRDAYFYELGRPENL